ncbi:MAG: thermonuclease family protein [bacterium]|nr:thermonuclease family protein [bacterium]
MSSMVKFFCGVGLALFFIGISIGSSVKKDLPDQVGLLPTLDASAVSQVSTATQTSAVVAREQRDKLASFSAEVLGELVKVTRVVDGDTIDVVMGGKTERVRYIGIDTPETVDPRKTVQCFGVEASKKNKELVEGKMVRLEKDITDRDKYKRLLRYVWLDDAMINRTLVQDGFAHSYSYPPDIKYQDQFVALQTEAREAKRGLWSACSLTTTTSVAVPVPVVSGEGANPSCTIKGNIGASGEKIYHMIGCDSYEKTRIDESAGEHWFCSESDAQAAGWRKALNCQ